MLKTLILRELLDYLKTTKFLIGMMLTVALVVIVTLVNITEYTARKQAWLDSTREPSTEVVFREPQPLSIFIQGVDLTVGEKKSRFASQMIEEDLIDRSSDPFFDSAFSFGSVDLLFVIKIILSLLVVFFAYDNVSGEKEKGTLGVSFANSLPRWRFMLGKMLGGFGVVTISLAVSMLAASLIIAFHPGVQYAIDEWVRLLLIFGVSLLYLAVFYSLSTLVSIITNSSASTLLLLVQLWILITIVVPGGSALLAQIVNPSDVPTRQETEEQTQVIVQEYNKKIQEIMKLDTLEPNEKNFQRDNFRFRETSEAIIGRVYIPMSNALTREARKVQNTMLISPAGLYERIALRLARTDFEEYDYFLQGVIGHWHTVGINQLYRSFNDHIELPEEFQVKEVPEFTYRSERVLESLARMGGSIFLLFLWSLVFFVSAHAAFLRKDVR